MNSPIASSEPSNPTVVELTLLAPPPFTHSISRKPFDLETLTTRQLEVLHLLAGGATQKAMAAALGISVNTLKDHLTALMKKAGAANRCHLAAIFVAHLKDHGRWAPHK